MKPTRLAAVWATLMLLPATLVAGEVKLHVDTVVRFAGVDEGRAVLSRRDRYIESLSPFDRQSKLRAAVAVSEKEFLAHAARQVVGWQQADVARLTGRLDAIRPKLARLKLPFPKTVLLIQTTGEEEGRAAYCRGNAVVLPRNVVRQGQRGLERLLIHELFHVLSSHNPPLQERLYKVVGFRRCNKVQLPAGMRDRRITNPDAPVCEHCVDVTYQDQPVTVVPVLFSEKPYNGETRERFFVYLNFRLMVVEKDQAGNWQPALTDNRPTLLEADEVPSFYEKIGRNTGYIIHPEEVLADNFVHLVNGTQNVKTPRIIADMNKLLSR